MENEFEQVMRTPHSRRAFLSRMGAAGLGIAATSLLGGTLLTGCGGGNGGVVQPNSNTYPAAFGSGDIRILNYALTLEILEADLYRQALNAATRRALTAPLVDIANARATYLSNGIPIGTGGLSGTVATAALLYLVQFSYVEAAHRDFLRVAIQGNGGTPVTANAGGYRFPGGSPGADLKAILTNIVPLEETGTRAYLGAVPDFASNAFLQVAGTISSTESRHSASLRYLLNPNDVGPSRMSGDREVTSNPPSVETFEKLLQVQDVLTRAQRTYYA